MEWGMRPIRSTDKCKCIVFFYIVFLNAFLFHTFKGKIIGKIRREIYGLFLSLWYFLARIFISFFRLTDPVLEVNIDFF